MKSNFHDKKKYTVLDIILYVFDAQAASVNPFKGRYLSEEENGIK